MKIRTFAATAAIAAALPLLAACGSAGGATASAPAACKEEMQRLFDKAMKDPDAPMPESTPPACRGVSEKQLKKYLGEIMEKGMKDGVEDAWDDAADDADDAATGKTMKLGESKATIGGSGTGELEVTPTTIVFTKTATAETPDNDLFATVSVKDKNSGAVAASESAPMESGGWKWVTKAGESIDAGEGNAAFNVVPNGFEGGGDIQPGTFNWSVAVFDLTKAQAKGGTLMYVDGNSTSYRWTAPSSDSGPQVAELQAALAE